MKRYEILNSQGLQKLKLILWNKALHFIHDSIVLCFFGFGFCSSQDRLLAGVCGLATAAAGVGGLAAGV